MILQNRVENEVLSSGNAMENIKMTLDQDSTAHLMMLLSTNLYSDNIGTPIQEVLSNSLDSTIEAGNTEPIIASITKSISGHWEFAAIDYGLGLDANDFNNIMSKYGKSTKRSNAEALGCLGIGSKSMFAYTDTFSFICRKDKVERMYLMKKDEIGFAIDLIYEKETDERNGVKVLVPIKNGDYETFKDRLLEKTAFFEQIYFHIEDKPFRYSNDSNGTILESINDFKIIDTAHFKCSSLDKSNRTKILLGRVNYDLDYSKLGISTSTLPIALKFSLTEGLFPAPNRENILYNTESKILILNKLKSAIEWMIEKYNADIKNINSLKEIVDFYKNTQYFELTVDNYNVSIQISNLEFAYKNVIIGLKKFSEKYNDLSEEIFVAEPQWDKLKYLSPREVYVKRHNLLYGWRSIAEFSQCRFTTKSKKLDSGDIINKLLSPGKSNFIGLNYKESISRGKLVDYIYETKGSTVFLRNPEYKYILGNFRNKYYYGSNLDYYHLLDLKKYPKTEWRARIQEWQMLVKEVESLITPLSTVQISQEWLDSKKKIREARKASNSYDRTTIGKQEINLKLGVALDKHSQDWNCKFVGYTTKIEDLSKNKYLLVYGTEDQRKQLDQLYLLAKGAYQKKVYKFSKKKKHNTSGEIKVAILGQRDIEKVSKVKIHNFKSIEQFMLENGKLIGKYVTAFKVRNFLDKHTKMVELNSFLGKYVNKSIQQEIEKLNEYVQIYNYGRYIDSQSGFHKTLISLVEENKWEDLEMISIMKKLDSQFEKLDFLKFIEQNRYNTYRFSEEKIPFIQEVLKARKFKMDYIHYDSPEKRAVEEAKQLKEKQAEEAQLAELMPF